MYVHTDYRIRLAQAADASACFAIEHSAYEGDEAATLETIQRRIEQYPQGFLVLELAGAIIGFVNSGCCFKVAMDDEHFKQLLGHDPEGPENVVMSVVIHPVWQRHGWGRTLLLNYIEHMRRLHKQRIHLMCRSHHIRFYQRCGFIYQSESASNHGGLHWHDMTLSLPNP
ncbi:MULTISPECIES: GNAT family N-acetyltransferase [unclassified Oceanobacter]|uniref:GNAT family N-acetyltransferase n=1 Tax=unclassified Oceanobacter TaxID=2620260 RepID=UPI0026E34846|nr:MULTISPECIES: GNAT family N-acetyltransferase [unclassified Oceanobacter]MDO6681773.1 GNAT family N-acetyltransferase [Oceanobacter sp. 5_MG-2023]MDP2506216.1 GNAT family N-acetyltransferase [Oceanobacter sp. 3_MG-2023]MDP2546522.1 GNAT family N-acetyltransferase [Oceanobacter sp. 4_MG-2023]